MEKIIKRIDEALNRLQNLHKHHMESFDQKSLPDLQRQSENREIEVSVLMASVKELVTLAEIQTGEGVDIESIMNRFYERVATLLEQNKALETRVSAFREQLRNNMKQVSKGKNAIGLYRSSTVVSNSPRVISITNY
jgi:hypothetical protein